MFGADDLLVRCTMVALRFDETRSSAREMTNGRMLLGDVMMKRWTEEGGQQPLRSDDVMGDAGDVVNQEKKRELSGGRE